MTSFSSRGNLVPAHRGYRYQDIWTAYVLVKAVTRRFEKVTVDRKQVLDDRIDDLEVIAEGRKLRQQLKSSQDAERAINEADFTAEKSSLRIDRLLLTHVRAGKNAAEEYRLCATWQPPTQTDGLTGLIEKVDAEPTITGWRSKHYRFRCELIWPPHAQPLWAPLASTVEFTREDFLEFCERFILELSLPPASTSLLEPGPLEQAVIDELSTRIGIGRYPNLSRDPADVAALAVSLANLARTQEATLTPGDVECELAIRTDFGRVAQSFPIDETLFHDRPAFRRSLLDRALLGCHQIIIAPPGAGKSWELTRLARDLANAGALVTRHYCYLQPGDELVEKRVTADVFFGNLLAELVDAAPELIGSGTARYAAGLQELEETLNQASKLERPVVLIIDGLDHIARVRRDSRSLADEDTDIVERLCTLNVPPGISLIIGSQPGAHLAPLRARWGDALTECLLPPWSPDDVVELAKLYKVTNALAAVGITKGEETESILSTLADRADGNPLYARYLAHGLAVGLKQGSIGSPIDWLMGAPKIDGEVAIYYEHLYRNASTDAQVIADLLAVIDFAVTETDLREILPALLIGWLPPALNSLAPILTASAGQGGIRIFHESFRRFMTEELARKGRGVADVLAPMIDWLEGRGFYNDAKSFRFLLPALRRAKRDAEVLQKVDVAFVSTSVAHAHHLDAIQRNLALAADVAATSLDWPSLVRCIELHRAAFTCFDESQNTWDDYWTAYLELFGSASLAERLLFEGRPTQPISVGLYACGIIDDAGGTAPWREYLEGFQHGDDGQMANSFDEEGELSADEISAIAVAHGRLRLQEGKRVIRWLYRCLKKGEEHKPLFLRRLAARMARMISPQFVADLVSNAERIKGHEAGSPRHVAAALLGVADEYLRQKDRDKVVETVTIALQFADTPELAMACVEYGAPAHLATVALSPSKVPIAVGPDEYLHTAKGVRKWAASLRLIARDTAKGPAVLARERARVSGVGWYRCWLRYVIGIASAEAAKAAGNATGITDAFSDLASDVAPFVGTPRACDLYAIRNVISESIGWGLALLTTESEWSVAIDSLLRVCEGTASKLDREDGGPLPIGTLLNLLIPHVSSPVVGTLARSTIEAEVLRLNTLGSYYSTHADYTMRLVRAKLAAGDTAKALDAWNEAAIYLCGYGWRKDVTLFEIIESAPALAAVSQNAANSAIADLQRLTNTVIAHTDGRSTNHAPNAWFRSLLEVNSAEAIGLLTQTNIREEGIDNWAELRAVRDCLNHVADGADSAILDAIYTTMRFEVEYENESMEKAQERLTPIIRLAANDPQRASSCLRRVSAEITGDGRRYTKEAARFFDFTVRQSNLVAPVIGAEPESPKDLNRVYPTPGNLQLGWMRLPAFPPHPTLVDILAGLRSSVAQQKQWDDRTAWDSTVLALSYHLEQFLENDQEDEARRLLRFFARDTYHSPSTALHPLGSLAEALENAGHRNLAAVAYVLAYTSSRGGGGYHCIGDRKHSSALFRGLALNSDLAHKVLAEEIAYSLRGAWYSMGASRNLVERVAEWGDSSVAEAAWREAFNVIAHRLPLPRRQGWFAEFIPGAAPDWSDNEALVALLLSRTLNPQLSRKTAALAGVVRAIKCCPDNVIRPLRWWMTRDIPVTSLLLVIHALLHAEATPFVVTKSIADVIELYARSIIWGARRLAGLILERAGFAVPPAPNPASFADAKPELTSRKRSALLAFDAGNTLEVIGEIWPELPETVLQRVNSTLNAEPHIERIRSRFRVAFGRDGNSMPITPVLFWQSEVLVSVLHEELSGLAAYLWSSGQWVNELEDSLVTRIVPDTAVHLGLAASRTARPPWPMPVSLFDGTNPLPVVGKEDPAYVGWVRFGMRERQYVHPENQRHAPPSEEVTVYAGAIGIPPGSTIPQDYFPFGKGRASAWWSSTAPPPSFPPRLPLGVLVSLNRITDWLGDAFLLAPPVLLKSYVTLNPPEYGEPLVWSDGAGNPAIVLRTWHVINPEALFAEPALCEGSDLIIRPDIAGKIRALCGAEIKEKIVVTRRPFKYR